MRKERDSSISTPIAKPIVLVFMGVSGCGKTTVAAILAGRLGWPFEEGDALHPQANVEKMAAGHPLTDEDRAPWLEKVARWVEERLDAGRVGGDGADPRRMQRNHRRLQFDDPRGRGRRWNDGDWVVCLYARLLSLSLG